MNLVDNDIKLDYADVLIRPKRSTLNSRSEVSLERTFSFNRGESTFINANDRSIETHNCTYWSGIPIIASNMDGVGNFGIAKELSKHKIMTIITKQHTEDDWIMNKEWVEKNSNYVAISTGTKEHDFNQLKSILKKIELKFICIDIANGYSQHFVEFCKKVRNEFPEHIIIAGNVVTREITEELILSGVDIVKIGIGPGAVCTTRLQTGVGFPQLSAVSECVDAAHGLGGKIIADGGCTCPGDVAKAFGAGADFVMLGTMFAGCIEGGGKLIKKTILTNEIDEHGTQKTHDQFYVEFYGMSSKTAQNKHSNGLNEYRSSEGRTILIPHKGSINDVVHDILGGLRSTCTYVGAKRLKELHRCVSFIRVSNTHNRSQEHYTTGQ